MDVPLLLTGNKYLMSYMSKILKGESPKIWQFLNFISSVVLTLLLVLC
jgi:hypothetical protein